MGQMKKIKELFDSYERLPDGRFKDSVRDDMEQIKELACEVNYYKKLRDKLEEKDVNTHTNG